VRAKRKVEVPELRLLAASAVAPVAPEESTIGYLDENGLLREEIDRSWFLMVCEDLQEIERLMRPSTAEDWLKRRRADAILDHPRLLRVGVARQRRTGTPILVNPDDRDFQEYLSRLDEGDRMICEDVPSGYILTTFPEAECVRTEHGNIVVVSEALRHFLYFMSLSTTELDVPWDVRFNAALIALRTMSLSETLDFELDPRGIVPEHIHASISELVHAQLQFIIGHEYAHHRLGHSFDSTSPRAPYVVQNSHAVDLSVYKREWVQEYDADISSVVGSGTSITEYTRVHGAIHFFLALLVYEIIAEANDPKFKNIQTHPPTTKRYWNVVKTRGVDWGVEVEEADQWLKTHLAWADRLLEFNQKYPDRLTRYGSMYLGQWRGPVLVDRVDY
jgi:hypothetical protein